MKSIFLVKTPLQLLNAVEAKHHYRLITENCIVVLMADRKSQSQLTNLAKGLNEWGCVVALNDISLVAKNPFLDNELEKRNLKILSKSFLYVWRLNKISRYLKEVDYIFVGYARYVYMKHFVNVTRHNKLVLLDDGHATILLAKERNDKQKLVRQKQQYKHKIKCFLKKSIQGLNDNDYEKLEYFTIYDVITNNKDSVAKHNYLYLRKSLGRSNTSNEVYFVGSPISEIGILSQSDYLKHLKRVKQFYVDYKLVYIAHRRENPLYLEEITRELGIDVVHFEYPIEYQMLAVGPRPRILASFISSALDSCSLIFEDEIEIISFKIELQDCIDKEEIENIYDAYMKNKSPNFSVITEY